MTLRGIALSHSTYLGKGVEEGVSLSLSHTHTHTHTLGSKASSVVRAPDS